MRILISLSTWRSSSTDFLRPSLAICEIWQELGNLLIIRAFKLLLSCWGGQKALQKYLKMLIKYAKRHIRVNDIIKTIGTISLILCPTVFSFGKSVTEEESQIMFGIIISGVCQYD